MSVTTDEKILTYAYDALGRKIKETQNEITLAKEYDLLDRLIEERIENASGKILTRKQFCYDRNGNRTHLINYSQAGVDTRITHYNPHNEPLTMTDALGYTSHFRYDHINLQGQIVNRLTHTDPLGHQTVKIYDTHQRLTECQRFNSFGKLIQSENYLYDAVGQKLQTNSQVFNAGIYLRTIVTAWKYDCMGNMIECQEAQGTVNQKNTRLIYNLQGQKEQLVKPDGIILHHQYDLFGRLKRFNSSDKTIDYSYVYDLKDNLTHITDHIHQTSSSRVYDQYNRLLSETLATGFTVSYTYDALDRPLTIIFPDQSAVQYVYNAHFLSRIDRLKDNQILYSHYYNEYDQAENLLSVTLPGQAGEIAFKYDLLQRLIAIKAPHWQESIPDQGYDLVGNLLQRQIVDAQGLVDYTYAYDDLYQLCLEKGDVSNIYANDSLQNRIAKNQQPYQLNELNQLLHESTSSYMYDANGNLITIKQENDQITLHYDALDRLIRVHKNELEIHYTYDSFHRRLSKKQKGVNTNFLYLKDNEIGVIESQTIKELRILGLGKGAEIGAAIAIELENKPYVPLHDSQGNIVTLLDFNGDVVNSYRYTAFGEEQVSGNLLNAWRYASKRVDPETGFIYFGRRFYMPTIGRWLTPDPLWFADGPNLYAYVHNRPLTTIDPDGQFAFLIPVVLSLALDYCLPTAVACLSEYAGGAIAASLLSGFVSGYSDPVSSVLDADTYTLGSGDVTSFVCNRAGMLIGAAVACKPTNAASNGVKAIANVASREIAGTVITKAEAAVTRSITTGLKQGAKGTAQKTALAAERNFAKGGISRSDLIIKETLNGSKHSSYQVSANEALESGMKFLGSNYKQIGKPDSGVFRSLDGLRGFRIDNGSLKGLHSPHSPHYHLEIYKPGANKPYINNHIRFYE